MTNARFRRDDSGRMAGYVEHDGVIKSTTYRYEPRGDNARGAEQQWRDQLAASAPVPEPRHGDRPRDDLGAARVATWCAVVVLVCIVVAWSVTSPRASQVLTPAAGVRP